MTLTEVMSVCLNYAVSTTLHSIILWAHSRMMIFGDPFRISCERICFINEWERGALIESI